MPLTPDEQTRLDYLLSKHPDLAPGASDSAPAIGLGGRFGQDVANIPSGIANTLIGGMVGFKNMLDANPETQLVAPRVPNVYDVPPPQNWQESAVDFAPNIATQIGAAMVPGSAVSRVARIMGAGTTGAALAGEFAAGAYLGAPQGGGDALGTGAEFAAIGAANKFLPRPYAALANAAIPFTGQLMRGHDPFTAQSLANDAVNVAVPLILGGRGRPAERPLMRSEPAPQVTPDGQIVPYIPPDRGFTMPGYERPGVVDDRGQMVYPVPVPRNPEFEPLALPSPDRSALIPYNPPPRGAFDMPGYEDPRSQPLMRRERPVRGLLEETTHTVSPEEQYQMMLEEQQGRTADFQEHVGSNGYELLEAVKALGGLPSIANDASLRGETKRIWETGNRGRVMNLVNRGQTLSLDGLRGELEQLGHNFDTPAEMLDAIEMRLATNKPSYGFEPSPGMNGGDGRGGFMRAPLGQYLGAAAGGAVAGPLIDNDPDKPLWVRMTEGAALGLAGRAGWPYAARIARNARESGQLNMFAGPTARGFKAAEASGEVRPGTYDQKPRFEVDDSKAEVNLAPLATAAREAANGNKFDAYAGKLGDVLKHDELFNNYPALREVPVFMQPGLETGASYAKASETYPHGFISLGTQIETLPELLKSTLHEVQHAVQRTEGFARGASPETYAREQAAAAPQVQAVNARLRSIARAMEESSGPTEKAQLREAYDSALRERENLVQAHRLTDSPDELYRLTAGEIEARNVEHRAELDAGTRRAFPSLHTEPIPPSQAIMRGTDAAIAASAPRGLMRRVDDAAAAQTEGKRSPLGSVGRVLEREFKLGRSADVDLAVSRGRGMHGLLFDRTKGAAKVLADMTPGELDALRKLQDSERTPADVAAWKSSARPEIANAIDTLENKVLGSAQDTLAEAEGIASRKAMYGATRGSHLSRVFNAFEDPKSWNPTPAESSALADQLIRDGYTDGLEKWQVEHGIGEMRAAMQRDQNAPAPQGAGSKIAQALYIQRKDLTPEQWEFLRKMQQRPDLDSMEKGSLGDIQRLEYVSPPFQEFLRTLSRSPRFDDATRAQLVEVANKKTLSPEMLTWLGEIKDPRQRLLYTVSKVIPSAANAETLNQLNKLGQAGTVPIMTAAEQAQAVQAAATGGDAARAEQLRRLVKVPEQPGFGVLAGKMAPREVIDALDAHHELTQAGWLKAFAKPNSWIKTALVPLNTGAHGRQWLQIIPMALIARVLPHELFAAVKSLRTKGPLRDELLRNGILGADFSAQELERGARDLSPIINPSAGNGLMRAGKAFVKGAAEAFGTADKLVRVAAYTKAKARFVRDGMQDAQAQAEATKFVDRYTMNYGAVANAVKIGRETPFISPFITYTAEMTRILKNLGEDALTGNASERTWALANIGSLVALPLLLKTFAESQLSPDDRKEWERTVRLSPDYAKGQLRAPLGRGHGGAFKYMNLAPYTPAGDFLATARNLAKGDLSGLLGENPVFGLTKTPLLNMAAEQITGRNLITREQLDGAGRAQALLRPALPPLLGYDGQRLMRAFTPNNEGGLGITNARTGRQDTPTDALLGLGGIKTAHVQPQALLRAATAQRDEELRAAKRPLMQLRGTNATDAERTKAARTLMRETQAIKERYSGLMRLAE